MLDPLLYEQFRDIGRDIYVGGLTSSHGGNLSVRIGNRIVIKRRGAQLGRLKPEDLVVTRLNGRDSGITRASTELIVHRAIYLQTSALAIVHSHPRTAVALSLSRDEILPVDNEGSYLLHKVPVVHTELTAGSKEVAELLPRWLKEYDIVMLRGHGPFAIGHLLEEAYQLTSVLEMACRIMTIADGLGDQVKEYRKGSDRYETW